MFGPKLKFIFIENVERPEVGGCLVALVCDCYRINRGPDKLVNGIFIIEPTVTVFINHSHYSNSMRFISGGSACVWLWLCAYVCSNNVCRFYA